MINIVFKIIFLDYLLLIFIEELQAAFTRYLKLENGRHLEIFGA